MKTGHNAVRVPLLKAITTRTYEQKDKLWLLIWVGGLGALWLWNTLFLNRPALLQIETAFLHTVVTGALVVSFTLILGWSVGVALYFLDRPGRRTFYLLLTFSLNVIRSVPQIVGVLVGYILLTILVEKEILRSSFAQMSWMALVISLFVFLEVVDLVRERIGYYNTLDFVPAMLCCGIRESRIVNIEILWKNSFAHIVHKLIAIFGISIFLQCSIDFIISVGLSTEVSSSNFPVTLGGVLAKMDSKQDILAIGTFLFSPLSVKSLFVAHLQGITVASIIVFTLLCVYHIANGFVRRFQL
jgi:ABC-type microcin C transport system permease subunit YejE